MAHAGIAQIMGEAARLHRTGEGARARALCEQALRIEPNRPDVLRLTARLAYEANDVERATELLRRAVAFSPGDFSLRVNLGMMLVCAREFDDAVTVLEDAVRMKPDAPEALANLGAALRQKGEFERAAEVLNHAAVISPGNTPVLVNLGAVLTNLGRFDDAIATLQTAVAVRADDELAHYNLAIAYKESGKLEDAKKSLDRVIGLRTSNVEARVNLGDVLNQMSRYEEAIEAFEGALKVNPDDASAQTNLGFGLLMKGEYANAWPLYESRQRALGAKPRRFNKARWEGQAAPGKRVMLYWEQGLGDTLQFVRYAKRVAERGLEVYFLCQKELSRLVRGQCGISQMFTEDERLPDFDFECPLLSLPGIFETTLENLPNKVPYLFADGELVNRWRTKVDAGARMRVGLNWAGSPVPLSNLKRTVGLKAMAPLLEIEGVEFYSMQKGKAATDANEITVGSSKKVVDLTSELRDFADTAALMWCMDRVITCDTSVAHLAGAMGVKTDVLLPFNPDWRWHLGREDSPWYPTLKLHRQPEPGDYGTPVSEVARSLREIVERR